MSLPVFPTLRGLGWPFTRTTIGGSTLVFTAASGAVTTVQLWSKPIYEWELAYDGLASNASFPGLAAHSKQLIEAFSLSLGGRGNPFLFVDAQDCYQAGSALGVGDGTKTVFPGLRNVASFVEPVDAILNVAAVYLSGVAQPGSAWTLSAPNGTDVNAITFTTAPAVGAVVTADIWYAFKCRFSSDSLEFKQIMSGLWQLEGVKFRRERV